MPREEKNRQSRNAQDREEGGAVFINPGDVPEGEEERLENEELLYELAQLYKVFADESRIRILSALLDGEAPVGALSRRLQMSMSAVSHSLRVLKAARLVRCRRDGKAVFYSLCDEHVKMILLLGLDHVSE